jgi:hypothetical protein
VLPSAELAYETGLSAGSIAYGAPTRICTELARLPSESIADNALGALEMVGARRLARPRLPDSESGGSAIPRKPRAVEIGVPDPPTRSALRRGNAPGPGTHLVRLSL